MDNGWISLHRRFQSHWLWKEKRKLSKAEAWIDILMTVNHSNEKVMIKGLLIDVKRGQSVLSLDSWASRWGWNKSAVKRLFNLLQSESMIVTESVTITTRLTVCNYDCYQGRRNADETQMKRLRNADETQMKPNNNDNKDNNVNNDNNNGISADAQQPFFEKPLEDESQSKPHQKEKEKSSAKKEKRFGKAEFREALITYGADPIHVDDWLAVRSAKRAVFTETALNGFLNECETHNFFVPDAVRICAENSWTGFKVDWLKNKAEVKSDGLMLKPDKLGQNISIAQKYSL